MIVWTIVRTFGLERGFPLVPLLAFTPYVIVLAAIAALVVLLLARRAAALAIATCVVVLLIQVAPRAIPNGAPEPAPEGPQLRVLSVNLRLGGADLDAIAELVETLQVDVISFSELTPEAARTISRTEIETQLPYSAVDPRDGASGTGLLSRYPLRRIPAPGREGSDAPTAVAIAEVPGGAAELWSIHPFRPDGPTTVAMLKRYLATIPPAEPDGPARILIGDFNSTLDNDVLRDLIDDGYIDAADARGAGLTPTWSTGLIPPPVAIDHVIADERAAILKYETADVPGSDHRAVFAELRLPGIEPGTFGPLPAED